MLYRFFVCGLELIEVNTRRYLWQRGASSAVWAYFALNFKKCDINDHYNYLNTFPSVSLEYVTYVQELSLKISV